MVAGLVEWYAENGRDFSWRGPGAYQPWQVLVIEILLQQTQAARVAEFLPGFFHRYPTLPSMRVAGEAALADALHPLGLHRRRAARLCALAASLDKLGDRVPRGREELEALPGVGQYVASAALANLYGDAEPTIDVNMARLVERLYGPRRLADLRKDPHIQGVSRRLLAAAERPAELNWAVLDLGSAHCRARTPVCDSCPLRTPCPTRLLRADDR